MADILRVLMLLGLFSRGLSLDTFSQGCLKSHNDYRKRHGAPAFVWSTELAADAQKWANKLAAEGKFDHDYDTIKSKGEGENLAYFGPPKDKCQGPKTDKCVECGEIVTDWYDEVKDYDFNTGEGKTPNSVVLHFTQVVWKDSTELGMATAVDKIKNRFLSVARYRPRGNMGGPEEFKKNVLPEGSPTEGAATTPSPSVTTAPATGVSKSSAPPTSAPTGPKTSPPTSAPPTSAPTGPKSGPPTSAPTGPKSGPPTSASSGPPPSALPPLSTTKAQKPSKCGVYYIINSTTHQQMVIQKCPGKPPKPVKPTKPMKPTKPVKPPSATPTGSVAAADVAAQKDALMLTNLYRTMHQASPIKLDKKLTADAQKWAERLAREQRLTHDQGNKDGENLAKMASGEKELLKAIDAWYDEVKKYNFKNGTFSTDTGHFTQLAWKSSSALGLGKAKSKDGQNTYVVARFRPSGNVIGQFKGNVFPKAAP